MSIKFDFDNITVTEFGLGLDQNQRSYVQVPVDSDVKKVLAQMAVDTIRIMKAVTAEPVNYEPSEKYSATEYLVLPLADELAASIRDLHNATNLTEDATALDSPDNCFAYFARFTDSHGQKLTAVRRASQFKGVLKKRLIRFVDNTLQVIPDSVFKLDNDFDFLVDSEQIYILRPSGLEFTAQLQSAIMAAVKSNIDIISTELTFVKFDSICAYAEQHPRAARYIASIRSQSEAQNINKEKLMSHCQRTGVNISEVGGLLEIDDSNVMGFLEVLDRRRYDFNLVDDSIERYRASARSNISQGSH